MRRLFALLLALMLMVALLSGCGNAPADGSTLNGIALSRFTIVYDENDTGYALRAAQYIQAQIQKRTGVSLPLAEDDTEPAEYEIVVGNTAREISQKLEAPQERSNFAILAHGNHVALEGEFFLIAAAAYYFVNTYIPGGEFHSQVPGEPTVCQPITAEPTSCILLIGDGMGVNHTKLYEVPPLQLSKADGYGDGEEIFYGYLLGAHGFARTDSLTGVTDSAAAGTALATGYKTYNEYVGLDQNGQPIENIVELANRLGKATAVMSTEAKTGATPSAFLAHVPDRSDKTAILKSQEAAVAAGTVINCNFDTYNATLIQQRVIGSFLKTLSQVEQDPEGFFLMYEEAYIDKHSHNNKLNDAFLALSRFNMIIGRAMEYACYHPNVFVLITADHETGDLQLGPGTTTTYRSEDHTGQDVPVFAHGLHSQLFDGNTVENVQIPKTIAKFWGAEAFGDPEGPPALE